MGLVISRLNFEQQQQPQQPSSELASQSSQSNNRLQQQDNDTTTMYSFYNQATYSLNKKHFSNFFLMAGERFEVDEPEYLFGDEYDLNFLNCTKPFYLPYKQARTNLLTILSNKKQKATNRAARFGSPFNKFTFSNYRQPQSSPAMSPSYNGSNNSRKQQQHDEIMLNKRIPTSPSKPLVMFVNIRKETLKLVVDSKHQGDCNVSKHAVKDEDSVRKTAINSDSNISKDNGEIGLNTGTENHPIEDKKSQDNGIKSINKPYNIQFYFDSEVDCSIRIIYSCTREVTSNGITFKPQYTNYKSKLYHYKKGMEQKFDQPEHNFQPSLFEEDSLMYNPLDTNGNHNPNSPFPVVIHCVALSGSLAIQSCSLVASIEKSQSDDGYFIKPIKQLIFVDGIQYILQDIYGIEHKQLILNDATSPRQTKRGQRDSLGGLYRSSKENTSTIAASKAGSKDANLIKSHSLPLGLNSSNLYLHSNLDNLDSNDDDNSSVASIKNFGSRRSSSRNNSNFLHNNRDGSIRHKSLASDANYECVICMSEERDTMLLPCRHLCLCGSCAQSLRYQASSCPICRCTFKAALNIRPSSNSNRSNGNNHIQPISRQSANMTADKQRHPYKPSNSNDPTSSKISSSKILPNLSNCNSSELASRVEDVCEEDEERELDEGYEQQVPAVEIVNAAKPSPSSTSSVSKKTKLVFQTQIKSEESATSSATPLLSDPIEVVVDGDTVAQDGSQTEGAIWSETEC